MRRVIAARAVQVVISGLERLGLPTHRVLSAAGMDAAQLAIPDGRVDRAAMARVWQFAAEETGDDQLGIHVAEAAPVRSFELAGYAFLSSPDLRSAYRKACRYQRLIHETNVLTFEEGKAEGVVAHFTPGGRSVGRHPAEFLVTSWIRLGRLLTGDAWHPSLVCFAHPRPDDLSEHTSWFGSNIRFAAGRTAAHLPNAVLNAANIRDDPGLAGVLDRYAESLLDQTPDRRIVSHRILAWLSLELANGEPTVAAAAKAVNMSVRSLHRSLQAEGTTYRRILDRLRHERATALLLRSRYSIAEVAFTLGFAELSSFYRAFRRWTGSTPAEYRSQVLG